MAKAAKKPKPKTRAELCRELLEIERDNALIFTRIDAIKTDLKLTSETEGKFRETFAGLGYVSVSPPRAAEVIGHAPVVDVAAWEELTDAKRQKLIDAGLVKIDAIIKGEAYGQVRTKLHANPEGASP